MKNIFLSLSLVLSISALNADNSSPSNGIHSTSIEQEKDVKEIVISLERFTIDKTFNDTVELFIKKQKTEGGVLNITSDETYIKVKYSKDLTQTESDSHINYLESNDTDNLLKLLKQLSIPNGNQVSMTFEDGNFDISVIRAE